MVDNSCNVKPIKFFITGYGAFMNVEKNPTELLIQKITENKEIIEKEVNNRISIEYLKTLEVSCDYVDQEIDKLLIDKSGEIFENQDTQYFFLHLGVNGGGTSIDLEFIAKNYIKDYIKLDCKIDEKETECVACKLDLNVICDKLNFQYERKVKISDNAGTYLCNYVYYKTNSFAQNYSNVTSIFIHVPDVSVIDLEEQYNTILDFIREVTY